MSDIPGWVPPTEPDPSGAGAAAGWGAGWNAPPPPGAQPPPAWGQQPGWGPPGAYAGWGYQAPKPGVIPLRPLGLGEILDGAFGVVRAHPRTTLGLSAIVVTTTQAIAFALQLWDRSQLGYGDSASPFSVGALLARVISGIGLLILTGMLTSVMGEAVLGRTPTIATTWQKVRARFWPLVGAGMLGGIVPYLALVVFIIPGVFLWGAWAFMTPAVVLEGAGVRMSIRRSWRLAVPDWWRVWGIRALAAIIAFVIESILVFPATLVAIGSVALSGATDLGVVPLAIINVGAAIAGTVTAPFTAGVVALLYIDRRMRVEGLDVTLARAAAAQPVVG